MVSLLLAESVRHGHVERAFCFFSWAKSLVSLWTVRLTSLSLLSWLRGAAALSFFVEM